MSDTDCLSHSGPVSFRRSVYHVLMRWSEVSAVPHLQYSSRKISSSLLWT